MSRPSGFVPIQFRAAGGILLTLGAATLTGFIISKITDWFSMSPIIGIAGGVLVLIGLYLIYMVPPEPIE